TSSSNRGAVLRSLTRPPKESAHCLNFHSRAKLPGSQQRAAGGRSTETARPLSENRRSDFMKSSGARPSVVFRKLRPAALNALPALSLCRSCRITARTELDSTGLANHGGLLLKSGLIF